MRVDALVVDPPRSPPPLEALAAGYLPYPYPINVTPLQVAAVLMNEGFTLGYLPLFNLFPAYQAAADGSKVRALLESYDSKILLLLSSVFRPSVATPCYRQSLEIAAMFKTIRPDGIVIMGGNHASHLPLETLQCCDAVDAVVLFECEEIIGRLVEDALRHGRVVPGPGVVSRDGTGAGAPQGCGVVRDVDALPAPAYELVAPYAPALRRHFPLIPVSLRTSRGCSFACAFCSASRHRRSTVYRSELSVRKELETVIAVLGKEGVSYVSVNDECLASNGAHARAVSEVISSYGIKFHLCLARASSINEEIAEVLSTAFEYVYLGVESCVPDTLQKLSKNQSLSDVLLACRAAQRQGLKTWLNWIVGLPGENPATMALNLRIMTKLKALGLADVITSSPLIPYPGSPLVRDPRQFGVRIHSQDWNRYDERGQFPVFRLPEMSPSQIYDYHLYSLLIHYTVPKIEEGWQRSVPGLLDLFSPAGDEAVVAEVARLFEAIERERVEKA